MSAQPKRSSDPEWRITQHDTLGSVVVSQLGTVLFQIDSATGVMQFWDKKAKRTISVNIDELRKVIGKQDSKE
ncbi:MAG: hypothetical protein HYZ49_09490 [Chloroflexi bacterium]|nr:hypothetical protein [Chloroflexota bacterium]